jgi:D-amino peptidase
VRGATDVLVNDAHGPMRNLLPDRLHAAARLVRGKPKPMSMLKGLDGSFSAAVFVGYHAPAGAAGGC